MSDSKHRSYDQDSRVRSRHGEALGRSEHKRELEDQRLAGALDEIGAENNSDSGLEGQLLTLLVHLLKWQFQPERRVERWREAISEARFQITLAEQPGVVADQLEGCFQRARRTAAKQAHLPLDRFPQTCPYPLASVLEDGWLPE